MRVFVINQRQEPLMPCSPRKARMLLNELWKIYRPIDYDIYFIENKLDAVISKSIYSFIKELNMKGFR